MRERSRYREGESVETVKIAGAVVGQVLPEIDCWGTDRPTFIQAPIFLLPEDPLGRLRIYAHGEHAGALLKRWGRGDHFARVGSSNSDLVKLLTKCFLRVSKNILR